jgi:hypothetical protein
MLASWRETMCSRCPPSPKAIVQALHRAGIEVDPAHLVGIDTYPGMFMRRYEKRPEFQEAFYRVV